MKRILIASLLSCVLVGGAFAQLTFTGDVYAGFEIDSPYGEEASYTTNHRDEGPSQFNLAANVLRENYGAKLDLKFQATDSPLSLTGAYGWVDFLNNSLTLTMGKISDAKWVSSLDSDHEYFFDDVTGFRLNYKAPIQGLNLGAAFPARNFDVDLFFKKIILGATYANLMFNTVIAYDLGNNARFLFGFNYTGIDELTSAGIQIKASNLATWDSELVGGECIVNEKIGYRVTRPFIISLFASQIFYGTPDTDTELIFAPAISYKFTPTLTASFTWEFNSPDYFKTTNSVITPCLEYTLKGPAVFYVQYSVELAEMKNASHKFGFGMDIKAF